ncbi:MAG: hypothetical protein C4523_08345 [Myxococcales bacterium]|nr:MAG: hypothetical protein C4523_08345 [Myxococcales bacterium]
MPSHREPELKQSLSTLLDAQIPPASPERLDAMRRQLLARATAAVPEKRSLPFRRFAVAAGALAALVAVALWAWPAPEETPLSPSAAKVAAIVESEQQLDDFKLLLTQLAAGASADEVAFAWEADAWDGAAWSATDEAEDWL